MATPQNLIDSANSDQLLSSELLALQIQVYLLAKIAGNTMSPQQLIDASNAFQLIADRRMAEQVIVYLLNTLAISGVAGGGQSGTGSPQGVVTAPPGTTYYDTAAQAFWVKGSGTGNTGWVELLA